jgi:hypothetical protein
MTFFKWAFLGAIILMANSISSAQEKFPLRSGEWQVTSPSAVPNQPPIVQLYCLNDDLWAKTLVRNHSCTITDYALTSAGASYHMSCSMKTFQMKGKVSIVFDGMTHMVGQGSFTMDTVKSGVSHSDSQTDYRWLSATCNPSTDVNLKVGNPNDLGEPAPKPVHRNHVDN